MTLLKTLRFIILLLSAHVFWENESYTPLTDLVLQDIFQDVTDRQLSHKHVREKRKERFPTVTVVILLDIPNDPEPTEFTNLLRNAVGDVILPFDITDDFMLTSINLTTACIPNSTGGQQCHCEDELLWSEEICDTYGACGNASTENCNCINGIPIGHVCEPSIILQHPIEVNIVITVDTPTITESSELINLLRDAVDNLSLPLNITDEIALQSWNLTTACPLNATGGPECQCEESFGWSCDTCLTYGGCSNASTLPCDCRYGVPPLGESCKPISSIAPCPPSIEVDIVLIVDTPTNAEPSEIWNQLRDALENISFPLAIAEELALQSWNLTTACPLNATGGPECQCEESFGWSCDTCLTYGGCSNASTLPCDCRYGVPPLGESCKPISSIAPCPPSIEVDIVLIVDTPTNAEPSEIWNQLRDALENISFPLAIAEELALQSWNLTTACPLNATGGPECQCEESFGWSCDTCLTYGGCSNASTLPCDCRYGVPPLGESCKPISSIAPCPPSIEVDIVLIVDTPTNAEPSEIWNQLRDALENISFPLAIAEELALQSWNLTTACPLNATGGPECQCEESFGWSCDTCLTYGGCSNASTLPCDCRYGVPPLGESCKPISSIAPCPPSIEVDIVLIVDTPTNAEPSEIWNQLRDALENISFPLAIAEELALQSWNLTTACPLNATGGPECQCEESFGWSCDTCLTYGGCSNASTLPCDCRYGVPPLGESCKPISSIAPCPPSIEVDIVLIVDTPTNAEPSEIWNQLRDALENISFPLAIAEELALQSWNLTTACPLNATGGPECQCEESFGWSCDTCLTYGGCSNASTLPCDCRYGVPPLGESCKPISSIAPCPPSIEVDIVLIVDTPTNAEPSEIWNQLRDALENISFPLAIAEELALQSWNLTTACPLNATGGPECQCEESFGWSCDTCLTYGGCSNASTLPCDCRYGVPPLGESCKPISSIAPCPPSIEVDIVLIVDTPTNAEPSEIWNQLRDALENISFPLAIAEELALQSWNLTTACPLNATGGPECQCEESFGWSCDTCLTYGGCSNASTLPCDCRYGVPPLGESCKPISSIAPCPPSIEVDIVLIVDTPTNAEPSEIWNQLRDALENISFPLAIAEELALQSWNLTTACPLNATGGPECQCEESFGWSCDTCLTYGGCSNASTLPCDCRYGVPPLGESCKPISSIAPCPPSIEVDIVLIVDTPTNAEPSEIWNQLRDALENISFPLAIAEELALQSWNLTTACPLNATGGPECQCEESFGWSCDTCLTYGGCSNASTLPCDCRYGVPPLGESCKPISSIAPCPPSIEVDIVLIVDTPTNAEPSEIWNQLRDALENISFPLAIAEELALQSWNLTTACPLNATGGPECQCEESFGWSCDTCLTYGGCSNASTLPCDCRYGVPPLGESCKPISSIAPCPPSIEVDIVLIVDTPTNAEPSEIWNQLRDALENISFPLAIAEELALQSWNLTTACPLNATGGPECQCEESFGWSCDTCLTYGGCSNASTLPCDCRYGVPPLGESCKPISSIAPCPPSIEVDIVLIVDTPTNAEPSEIWNQLRDALENISFPLAIAEELALQSWNLTTACPLNATGGPECQCEESFGWSCDTCLTYGGCSNASTLPCDCRYGVPPLGESCKPISSIAPCPPSIEVDIVLIVDTPTNAEPSEIWNQLRDALENISFPLAIAEELALQSWNLTTACPLNATGGPECQCEESFGWSCDTCLTYGGCSNASTLPCDCRYGVPPLGESCKPISSIAPCPPSIEVDIVLIVDTPTNAEPSEIWNQLRDALENISFPLAIAEELALQSWNLTTACPLNATGGPECQCEESFGWSCDTCLTYGGCSNASTLPCDCRYGVPPLGESCKPISSIAPCPPSIEVDIVLIVDTPTNAEPSEIWNQLRDALENISFPLAIAEELALQSWNLTTACPLNATGGPECQCEESFGWSCDTCLTYGGCSNASTLPCDCRYGVPPLGESCKPISSIAPCPPSIEVDIVLIVDTPTNAEPSEIWNQLRDALENISFPLAIAEELALQSWNLTTACPLNATGGPECQCEESFGWSCDTCLTYGGCSNASTLPCDCRYGVPPLGESCKPISSIAPCPPSIEVDIVLIVDTPTNAEPSEIWNQLRDALENISFPLAIAEELALQSWNLTTACPLNATGGPECQCEESFGWSCDTCLTYGGCSNASTLPCDCRYGVPPLGESCKPISSIAPCPPSIEVDIVLIVDTPTNAEPSEIWNQLRDALENISFPLAIAEELALQSWNLTTACPLNATGGPECQCEESFGWSCDTCLTYGGCSNASTLPCDCRYGVPPLGESCKPISSIAPCPPSIEVDIVLIVDTPTNAEPSEIWNQLRDALENISFPLAIAEELALQSWNLTTACPLNATGGPECQCEESFGWSCDTCLTYGGCSNASTLPCDCRYGVPPLGESCKPISSIAPCPPSIEVDIVLIVDTPTNAEPSEIWNQLRDALENISFPLAIAEELALQSWNLTTACPLNATGGPECQCEESFGWSCDTCLTYGGCSNASTLPCDCRYGVPPLGESCKPISSIAPCPPSIEVDIVLIVDTPTNAEPSEIWNQLRDALENISFPLAIAEELALQSWNLTTACPLNATGGPECQCEESFGWSCDTCLTYGGCSNASTLPCDCRYGVPPLGESCKPISSIAPCPPSIEVDIVLIVDTPTNAEPSEIWNQLRDALENISFPLAIAEELALQSWNLTTACPLNATGGPECQCEESFGWSCDTCLTYGGCSNASTLPCDCRYGVPPLGESCKPISSIAPCPPSIEVDIVLIVDTPTNAEPSEIWNQLRDALENISFPLAIAEELALQSWNLTTACPLNATGGPECQCEESFGWSCDTCLTYGGCSNASTLPCDCRYGVPPLGESCKPISSIAPCPPSIEVDIVLIVDTPTNAEPSEIWNQLRDALENISFPLAIAEELALQSWNLTTACPLNATGGPECQCEESFGWSCDTCLTYGGCSNASTLPCDCRYGVPPLGESCKPISSIAPCPPSIEVDIVLIVDTPTNAEPSEIWNQLRDALENISFPLAIAEELALQSWNLTTACPLNATGGPECQCEESFGWSCDTCLTYGGCSNASTLPCDCRYGVPPLGESCKPISSIAPCPPSIEVDIVLIVDTPTNAEPSEIWNQLRDALENISFPLAIAEELALQSWNLTTACPLNATGGPECQCEESFGWSCDTCLTYGGCSNASTLPCDCRYGVPPLGESCKPISSIAPCPPSIEVDIVLIVDTPTNAEPSEIWNQLRDALENISFPLAIAEELALQSWNLTTACPLNATGGPECQCEESFGWSCDTCLTYGGCSNASTLPCDCRYGVPPLGESCKPISSIAPCPPSIEVDIVLIVDTPTNAEPSEIWNQLRDALENISFPLAIAEELALQSWNLTTACPLNATGGPECQCEESFGWSCDTCLTYGGCSNASTLPCDCRYGVPPLGESCKPISSIAPCPPSIEVDIVLIVDTPTNAEPSEIWNQLRDALENISFPLAIAEELALQSWNLTTACPLNATGGPECQCEESFGWSCDTCLTYGGCSNASTLPCDCRYGVPPLGESCKPISSIAPCPPSIEVDIVLIVDTPTNAEPSEIWNQLRDALENISFPLAIAEELALQSWNLTTACPLNATGGPECQCEESFGWSCDTCLTYGGCSNASTLPCDCRYGVPPLGESCKPISSIAPCPPSIEVDIVLIVDTPTNAEPSEIWNQLRDALENISFPLAIAEELALQSWNLTTACPLNATGGPECQCEESFGWSCDTCLTYGGCSNASTLPCDCRYGVPPLGESCKPISSIAPCPPSIEVDIVLIVDTPTNAEPSEIWNQLRDALENISFPLAIAEELALQSWNLTTACPLNATGGPECQCEESFGWSCDTCLTYGGCSNASTLPCDCRYGVPPLGESCKPISSIAPCPPSIEVDIVLIVDTPTNAEPSEIWNQLRDALENISFPLAIAEELALQSWNLTTACPLNATGGPECQCEESFGWSCDTCLTYGGCSNASTLPCDCRYGVPPLGESCKPISSIAPCPPSIEVDIVLIVDTPTNAEPSEIWNQLRDALENISFPLAIAEELALQSWNLTTACPLNATGGPECQCEESFGWSCDTCLTYGGCSNASTLPCDCRYGVPPLGESCKPISSIAPCPPSIEVDIVLIVDTPTNAEPSEIWNQLRDALENISFPLAIAEELALQSWNLTTACPLNATGGPECQCEESFGWSCDTCLTYGGCSNASTLPCDCRYGVPPLGESCKPISSIAPCPPSIEVDIVLIVDTPTNAEPSEIWNQLRDALENISFPLAIAEELALQSWNLTTACPLNATGGPECQCEESFGWSCDTCLTYGGCSNASTLPCDCRYGVPPLGESCKPISSIAPCPPSIEVDIVLIVDTPTNAEPSEIWNQLRDALENISFPLAIAEELALQSWNLTTACPLNATGGPECQCEESFGWSCDTCLTYGGCSNASTLPCDCRYGVPPLGESCKPISSIAPCPPSIEVDIVLIVDTPTNAEPSEIWNQLRDALENISFPLAIAEELALQSWNLTTACPLNATGGPECQCEESFGWSCDTCLTYGGCSNASTLPCDCRYGVPPLGESCKPISSIAPCPPSIEVDIVLIVDTPTNAEPSEIWNQLRVALENISFPLAIAEELALQSWNLTTACPLNATGGPECQCEESFGWSCDTCLTYGGCSNASTLPCDCRYGVPPLGESCKPISSIAPCPPSIEVDIVLIVDTPTNAEPSEIWNQLRDALENISFPLAIAEELALQSWNLTTACPLNATGGPECQCEESFGWSCDTCLTYGGCSNASTLPCDCRYGVPPLGESCKPISSIAPCPPSIEVDIVLFVDTPTNAEPSEIRNQLRNALENVSFPLAIAEELALQSWNLTTACYTDLNQQQQCQCENDYWWSCEICEEFGACSHASMQNCDCINKIPSDGQYCELNVITTCSTTTATTTQNRSLSFIMEIDFDDSYNDENNSVNQRWSQSIETQSRIHIPGQQSSDILGFRDGSTIVDFEITANMPIQDSAVDALLVGIFNDLKDTFPVRIDSRSVLEPVPTEVFFNDTVTLTCGPPPPTLDFTITSSMWTLDGDVIIEDERHRFERVDRNETLTITNSFSTDEGRYQCRLFDGQSVYVQDSNQTFSLLETPTIQVVPRQNTILCEVGQQVSLQCFVQDPYEVEFPQIPDSDTGSAIQNQVTITQEDCDNQELIVTCREIGFPRFEQNILLLLVRNGTFTCVNDPDFGDGFLNQVGRASCEINEVGEITAICRESGEWEDRENECILQRIAELLFRSQFLDENNLPEFLDDLSNATIELSDPVTEDPNNIEAIVTSLNNVGNFVTEMDVEISQVSMEDVLLTTGVLTTDPAIEAWNILNFEAVQASEETPRNESFSSLLLFSLEDITRRLTNASFNITTPLVLLNKTTFINNFNGDFNSTVEIDIEGSNGATNLTVITFESLDNVLPPRDENNATGRVINGRVVLVQSDTIVNNITFTFDIINDNLGNPQCVFWNFSLFDGLGGWDDEGCELVERVDQTVTCRCDHLTSFSILMSPFFPNSLILSFITFIGVAISMASLVICLLIEGYMFTRRRVREDDIKLLRNISIMNIALSLLIANVWFIIGSSITEDGRNNRPACTAATFFIHFFYLALFFWMLNFAMLLLYNMFNLFGGALSKRAQLIIGFSLGYGTPLLIATITIAVTAPNDTYIQETAICWLNWNQSKALLAFVIPALIIVFINILILIVVIIKFIQSRGMQISVKDNAKNTLGSIVRTLAILTPFFGVTWSLGVGTLVDPSNFGIHAAFAFFNSLQGFFVLVFGTLLDRTVQDEIAKPFSRLSQASSGSGTRVTSSGTSSNIFQVFKNIGRGGGNETSTSASSQAN
ncbi:uncharacterized protein LOC119117714 isoform X1 [Syngnathus acus]|uniref:uncharacterized protein LOC119117714 isoform X1 n=1 Tax=Syngnathus acus TaxID=161584 RepID=UPI0018860C1F|nr:uncharacterized protein LOC119117714 isoform X1 [Syngnathus acus]